jgi:hypothetical protein
MKFVLSVFILFLTAISFACLGSYLLMNGHPIAGGWLIAASILDLVGTQIRTDDNKEKKDGPTNTNDVQ